MKWLTSKMVTPCLRMSSISAQVPRRAAGGAGPVMPAIGGSGTGLIGLTERVRLAGGELDHQVTDGEFRLSASLPWPA